MAHMCVLPSLCVFDSIDSCACVSACASAPLRLVACPLKVCVSQNKIKGQLEQTATEIGFTLLQLIRPGIILGTPHTPMVLVYLAPLLQPLLPGWIRSTSVDDIAAGMLNAALRCIGKHCEGKQILHPDGYMAEAGRPL